MEDVLDTYALPPDPEIPLVCMDEKPYQLLGERNEAIPMKSGQIKKEDYEYVRNGTCSIFVFTAPHENWRHTSVREQRTSVDWAEEVHHIMNEVYPDKKKVRFVMDNLNTHKIGSLYEKYSAPVAREIVKRMEIHFTPKHGSWLNIAEIELSALETQCLNNRRIESIALLREELSAWHTSRNSEKKTVDWQFTTADARTKLKRLYPVMV